MSGEQTEGTRHTASLLWKERKARLYQRQPKPATERTPLSKAEGPRHQRTPGPEEEDSEHGEEVKKIGTGGLVAIRRTATRGITTTVSNTPPLRGAASGSRPRGSPLAGVTNRRFPGVRDSAVRGRVIVTRRQKPRKVSTNTRSQLVGADLPRTGGILTVIKPQDGLLKSAGRGTVRSIRGCGNCHARLDLGERELGACLQDVQVSYRDLREKGRYIPTAGEGGSATAGRRQAPGASSRPSRWL